MEEELRQHIEALLANGERGAFIDTAVWLNRLCATFPGLPRERVLAVLQHEATKAGINSPNPRDGDDRI